MQDVLIRDQRRAEGPRAQRAYLPAVALGKALRPLHQPLQVRLELRVAPPPHTYPPNSTSPAPASPSRPPYHARILPHNSGLRGVKILPPFGVRRPGAAFISPRSGERCALRAQSKAAPGRRTPKVWPRALECVNSRRQTVASPSRALVLLNQGGARCSMWPLSGRDRRGAMLARFAGDAAAGAADRTADAERGRRGEVLRRVADAGGAAGIIRATPGRSPPMSWPDRKPAPCGVLDLDNHLDRIMPRHYPEYPSRALRSLAAGAGPANGGPALWDGVARFCL